MKKQREHIRRIRTKIGRRKIMINRGIKKRPQKIGSLWHGKEAIHGPRLNPPKKFKRIWISKQEWPRSKWFDKGMQNTVRAYARTNKLKLTSNFPKNTKVKIGLTKKGKFKPQSFITPVKRNS